MIETKLPPLPDTAFAILPRQSYFDELDARLTACKDGDMAALLTMTFNPLEPQIKRLTTSLKVAAKRGVRIRLGIDANAFMAEQESTHFSQPGPLLFHREVPKKSAKVFQLKANALEDLRRHGIECVLINQPRRIMQSPYSGRSHIKLALINDTTYIGGCNLGMTTTDLMVRITDPRAATWLWEQTDRLLAHRSTEAAFGNTDQVFALDERTSLMLDAGKKHQSEILAQVLRLVDEAKQHIYFVCQYYPHGVTLKHLSNAAKRGVKVVVVSNDPRHFAFPLNLAHEVVQYFDKRVTPQHFVHISVPRTAPYLHAKILATEQAVMVGSHNHISAGVTFGTAELSLLRRDPAFSDKVVAAFESTLTTQS